MARGHLEPLRYSRAQLVRDVEDEDEEEEDVNARALRWHPKWHHVGYVVH